MSFLVRAAIFTRWGRYLLAVLFLAGAVFVGYTGFANSTIMTKTGVLADGADYKDKGTGAYSYSELTLQGDTTAYRLVMSEFTPKLTIDAFVKGGTIDLWYIRPLDGHIRVVAIQVRDEQDQNPTKYVTSTYTDPNGEKTSSFIGAGVILLFALGAALAGAFLPTEFGRKKQQPVPVASGQHPLTKQ